MPNGIKIMFSSDLHGSEVAFGKLLNAAKIYKTDYLVIGGDIVSKRILTVERSDGRYLLDRKEVNWEELTEKLKRIGNLVYVSTRDEIEELKHNPEILHKVYINITEKQVDEWLNIADDKLRGTNIKVFWNTGSDDPVEVDRFFIERGIEITEGKSVELGDISMVSCGHVNITGLGSYRELSESSLQLKLSRMLSGMEKGKAILNAHAPSYGTKVDLLRDGTHVGSRAVLEVIREFQPALAMHRHIHESPGEDKIFDTSVVNPGSEYYEGIMRAYFIFIRKEISGRGSAYVQKFALKSKNLIIA